MHRVLAALSGAVLVAGLAACSSGGSGSSAEDGGTVRVGMVGSAGDLLIPPAASPTPIDHARAKQIWEGLADFDGSGQTQLVLAESMTPNEDNTVWTVTLRPGVKLHNGLDFTATDVVDTIRHILDPAVKSGAAGLIKFIDPDTDIEIVDDLTLRFTLDAPYGDFETLWASNRILMASWVDGEPIGTGPFTRTSFTPGQESTFTKFADYWGDKPEFETLQILSFRDTDAIASALRGGQIDIAPSVPFTDVPTLEQPGISLLKTEDAVSMPDLEFRTDVAPFNDPRVMEAMKLLIDRDAVASNIYGGFAVPANDIYTNGSTCTPPDVPQRTQDIPRAKALLAEAGQSTLTFELTVMDAAGAGAVELAQLFAQHASEAGVTVNINQIDIATFFQSWKNWTAYIAFDDDSFSNTVSKDYVTGAAANGTHFADPEFDALAAQMFATAEPDARCAIVSDMMRILHDRSGWIYPASVTSIVAYNDRVKGLQPDVFGQAGVTFAGVSIEN